MNAIDLLDKYMRDVLSNRHEVPSRHAMARPTSVPDGEVMASAKLVGRGLGIIALYLNRITLELEKANALEEERQEP